MKNKKFFLVFISLGTLCIVSSLFIAIYTQVEEEKAKTFSNEVVVNFTEQISSSNEAVTFDTSQKVDTRYVSTLEIDDQEYIGVLCVPSLNLTLPVASDWDYNSLKNTPCTFSGTIENKNLVIAGHNYKSHFGYLDTLNIDDTAYILDASGNVHNYKITFIQILEADDITELLNNEWDLTLFTCVKLNNTHRYVVRLNEIDD